MFKLKGDFLWDGYTVLNSDWINNMDLIFMSGIEPSSVILIQPK